MSVDYRETSLPSSPNNDLPTTILAPLIDAISTCIRSIHQALDVVCNIETDRLISLPTVALARTSYPVVSLIKIYSILVASNTHIGKVIDMNSLKIEHYLEKVIGHYRTAAARDGGRAASKFGNIIMMLRNWFLKKRENGPALREIFGTEVQSDTTNDKQAVCQNLHLSNEAFSNSYRDSARDYAPSATERSCNGRPSESHTIHSTPISLRPRSLHIVNLQTKSEPTARTINLQPSKSPKRAQPYVLQIRPNPIHHTLEFHTILLTFYPWKQQLRSRILPIICNPRSNTGLQWNAILNWCRPSWIP